MIADVRTSGRATPPQPEIFLPYTHAPTGSWDTFQRSLVLVVRPSEDWAELYIPRMRTALRTVDPSVPLYDIRTMDSANLGSGASRRFSMQLLSLLALTGLGLATMGLFGVINYFVTQRTGRDWTTARARRGTARRGPHGRRPRLVDRSPWHRHRPRRGAVADARYHQSPVQSEAHRPADVRCRRGPGGCDHPARVMGTSRKGCQSRSPGGAQGRVDSAAFAVSCVRCHLERNHQGLGNTLIAGAPARSMGSIRRRPRLGRLLNYYERAA